jgi:hypothetical protein
MPPGAAHKKNIRNQHNADYHEHFCIKQRFQSNANSILCVQTRNLAIWSAATLLPLFPKNQHDSIFAEAQ